MEKEKLNKAADILAGDTYDAESRLCFIDGVVACADWLMQQPLSERLTDEEKEKIRAKYNELKSLNAITNKMFADDTAILDWLFGADLFKEK